MAEKISHLRVFGDADGKMNLALKDLDPHGEVLAVSNFTVYGDTRKSRRPSFVEAAAYERGEELFQVFLAALSELGIRVQSGVFGADMQVSLINDGPVTLIVET
jgi:D-aminoacyl-tRNA deacylase